MTNNSLVKARLIELNIFFWMKSLWFLCDNNYKSSATLPRALNEFDLPYGGINYDILKRLCSVVTCIWIGSFTVGTVGTKLISHKTIQGQKAAIGKALWHQMTTIGNT